MGMDIFNSFGLERCFCTIIDFLRRSEMKEGLLFLTGFLLFIGTLTFVSVYEATMRQSCREVAIAKGYSAIEVQAVCKL
jgi:hypothetical protein